jgi:crossover junction endodeoxyribonuclease RusA
MSTEIVLDLPFPVSTNRLWRANRGRVHRSKAYIAWTEAADATVMASRQFPKKKIHGPFTAQIILNPAFGRGDADNHAKAPLDWCVSRGFVGDDRDCRRLTIEWGEAEHGCRLILCEAAG